MFSWLNIHKLLETSLLDDEHHILSYTTICKKMFCQTPAEDNTFLFISQCLTSFFYFTSVFKLFAFVYDRSNEDVCNAQYYQLLNKKTR